MADTATPDHERSVLVDNSTELTGAAKELAELEFDVDGSEFDDEVPPDDLPGEVLDDDASDEPEGDSDEEEAPADGGKEDGDSEDAGDEPEGSQPPEDQKPDAGGDTPDEDDFDLDEDEFDPKLVKVFRQVRAENKALKAQLEEVSGFIQEQQIARAREIGEKAFSSILDDFSDHLGAGPTDSLAPNSKEFKNRKAVLGDVNALIRAANERGEQLPEDPAELFRRAARGRFGISKSEVREKRNSQLLHRPSARKTPDRVGLDAAIERSRRFDAELGE
jgi:hypothetical protein